ncbi:hypothetical protein [Pseudomonas sp. NBRC 111142]|uniref:hypothetical protein n=1 Tax=Pseudomonas sp. NBRC 111142 TaxID=1661057 RepID=UPI000A53EEC9|nr:hypothetical protein [Pseudomonas sp. NBRC 111142]
MNQAHHHPGLLFESPPCTGHTRAIAPGQTPIQTSEESGRPRDQVNATRTPALLREAAGVVAQETKSLCCAAAGNIPTLNAHSDSHAPHDRLRQATPADATLIASHRPHAQPAKGYTHLSFFALTAKGQAVCSCIAAAINATLSGNPAGVFTTVDEMALAIHDALLQAGALHPEHSANAWLGQAGLYRTRLEAVQNGEQHVELVSADSLIELARGHVREGLSHTLPQKETHS